MKPTISMPQTWLRTMLVASTMVLATGRYCLASNTHPGMRISSHAIREFLTTAIGSDEKLAALVPSEAAAARLPFVMNLWYPERPGDMFISGYRPIPYATLGAWNVVLKDDGPVHEGIYFKYGKKTFRRNGDQVEIDCEDILLYPSDSDGLWLRGRGSTPTLKGWIARTYTLKDSGKFAYGDEVHEIAAGGVFANLAGTVRSVAIYEVTFIGRVEPGKP